MALSPRIPKATPVHIHKDRDDMDRKHLGKQGECPCLACGVEPFEGNGIVAGHHLISGMTAAGLRGKGIKVPDKYSVPVCFACHGKIHGLGSDELFFAPLGIDVRAVASALWAVRGEDIEAYRRVIFRARQAARLQGPR